MKRDAWLKFRKKSQPEVELEPPFWLGSHSNGEYFHAQTPQERLIRRLILERADASARKHGIDRRQFLASSMGVATSLSVINWVAGCSSSGRGSAGSPAVMAGSGSAGRSGIAGSAAISGAAGGPAPGRAASPSSSFGGRGGVGGSAGSAGRAETLDAGTVQPDDDGGGVGGRYSTGDPMDPECSAEMMLDPKNEFVFDMQTHHVDRIVTDDYRNFFMIYPEQANCGKGLPGCFLRDEYINLMFLQSNTSVAMLSAVPALDSDQPLTNAEIAASRDYINQLARSERVLIQGQVLPNYRMQEQLEGMQRLVEQNKINCWKVHTEWGPANTWGNAPDGYWLDDPMIGIPFIEQARKTGVKIFCCHKGVAAPLFNAEFCSPRDIGPVAKMFPDTSWVVYHSAYLYEPLLGVNILPEGPYVDGSMRGVDSLVTTLEENGIKPNQNVYAELGSCWNLVMPDPTAAAHTIGKLLLAVGENNLLWGSDAIWTAKPQPYVDAFWNFEITPQFQERYGYPALTKDLKRKVLGLNAARLFDVDPTKRRCEIDRGQLANLNRTMRGEFGALGYIGQKPLGPTTRREFMQLGKWREHWKTPG